MLDAFRARMGIKRHNHPIDLLAEANGLLSGIALYPQVFKALSTRHVADLAPSTFFIVFVTNIIWFAYAIHRRALPVIIASILNLVAAGVLIAFFFTFPA